MMARGGPSQAIGTAWRAQVRQMVHAWHRVRDGTLPHAECQVLMRPRRRQVARRLKAAQTCGVAQTEGVCREGLTVYDALWTFVRVAGLEPTHHTAARAIRPGGLWRNGSLGTQSAHGSRVVDTMPTVLATLKQQHRTVLAYVTDACQAASTGLPPALLPCHGEAVEDRPVAASHRPPERLPCRKLKSASSCRSATSTLRSRIAASNVIRKPGNNPH